MKHIQKGEGLRINKKLIKACIAKVQDILVSEDGISDNTEVREKSESQG
jgi:hypothetical protein